MKRTKRVIGTVMLTSTLALSMAFSSLAAWKSDKRGKWYDLGNGQYYIDCWKDLGGHRYHFGLDGYAQVGWFKDIDGSWYLLNNEGQMTRGWNFVNNNWYYLSLEDGKMATGWVKVNNEWYYLNPDGSMRTGWYQENGKYYLLDVTGKMLKGWQQVGNDWYYLNDGGEALTGQQRINGSYYLFDSTGKWLDSASSNKLLNPVNDVEYTTVLEANMSTSKIRGLTNYYYDLYYNDINTVFSMINDLRGVGNQLDYSENLCKAATAHAIDMVSYNYFGHDNSNSTDVIEWKNWARAFDANIDGECLAHDITLKFCVDSLAADETSLRNLQDGAFTTCGVGFAQKADGEFYLAVMLQK